MEDLENTALRMLVGRVQGWKYSTPRLTQWIREIWGGILESLLEVDLLRRGWFSLTFNMPAQTDWVLKQYWHIEMNPVLLKHWTPLFDPIKENAGVGPIWMRLPGLPVQFWNETAFRNIGEDFGHYLDHDRSYLVMRNKMMARILIFLDTRDGLHDNYNMFFDGMMWQQPLDYEGVPFRCRKCHEVGHIYKECLKMGFNKPIVKKTKLVESQTDPITCNYKSDVPQTTVPETRHDSNQQTTNVELATLPKWPVTHARSHAPMASDTLQRSATVPGTPPHPASSNLLFTPISNVLCTPIKSFGDHLVSISIPSLSCTIAQAPPSISPSIPHTIMQPSNNHSSLCSDSSSSKHPYYLRSVITQPFGALGIGPGLHNIPPKNIGRPSELEKAIKKANIEVEAGTQSTLMWVLRARRPKIGVTL